MKIIIDNNKGVWKCGYCILNTHYQKDVIFISVWKTRLYRFYNLWIIHYRPCGYMRGVYKWQVIKFLSTLFPLPLHVVSTCYKQVLHILIHIVYPQFVDNYGKKLVNQYNKDKKNRLRIIP